MRNWSIIMARVRGIEFRLHITFFFLLVFILLIDANHGGTVAIGRGFALGALVLVSVIFHELGHMIAAGRLSAPLRGSILMPIGGIPLLHPNALVEHAQNLRRELRIAIAGLSVSAIVTAISGGVILAKWPSS